MTKVTIVYQEKKHKIIDFDKTYVTMSLIYRMFTNESMLIVTGKYTEPLLHT